MSTNSVECHPERSPLIRLRISGRSRRTSRLSAVSVRSKGVLTTVHTCLSQFSARTPWNNLDYVGSAGLLRLRDAIRQRSCRCAQNDIDKNFSRRTLRLSGDHSPSQAPMGRSESTWSKMIFVAPTMGIASTSPMAPQIHAQNSSESVTASGFNWARRPTILG